MIAFLSDFGLEDPYVGIVKGVIARFSPSSTVVDITHGIRPGHVRQASFVLGVSFQHFPSKTVFLAVVDPGVGSSRRGIVVEAGGHLFVGPDNGIFTHVLKEIDSPWYAHEIAVDKVVGHSVSNTFHARDVFAPVAALLEKGWTLEDIGPGISDDIVMLDISGPEVSVDKVVGEVVYIDHFGNAITNIPMSLLAAAVDVTITVKGVHLEIVDCYEEGRGRRAFGIHGSHGYLEISSYMKGAREVLGLQEGDEVVISMASFS